MSSEEPPAGASDASDVSSSPANASGVSSAPATAVQHLRPQTATTISLGFAAAAAAAEPSAREAHERPVANQKEQRPDDHVKDEYNNEIDIIKAQTMHQMVTTVNDGSGGTSKKLMFLSNIQASVISSDIKCVKKMLSAFELRECKLIIRFLPAAGGAHTIDNGMMKAFRSLNRSDPTKFCQEWKKLLRTQAMNNPNTGIVQDVLPVPPYLRFEDMIESEYALESFMRDVLVPLAAETNALVVGSAFKDDTMMMTFAKVAASLDFKYGGVGVTPWLMMGFADAPSLCMACCDKETMARSYFKGNTKWQKQYSRILRAKVISDRIRQGKFKQGMDILEEDKMLASTMEDPFQDDEDIMYDINPNIGNLVIVDGVEVKHGRVVGVSTGPQAFLEAILMDYLVSTCTTIGVASMHAMGGYAGMMAMSDWINMQVPVLLLDIRKRQPYTIKFPSDAVCSQGMSMTDSATAEDMSRYKSMRKVEALEQLFREMEQRDLEFDRQMLEAGKVDIFEICRMAHFHGHLLPKEEAEVKNVSLFEAIEAAFEKTKVFNGDEARGRWNKLMDDVVQYLISREFKAYWDLKPDEEIKELAEQGILNWEMHFKDNLVHARAAAHAVLTHDLVYSAHASSLVEISHVVNKVMMKKDLLPSENTLEGLMIVRSAWDVVDAARYTLRGYKLAAKLLYLLIIVFAVVYPSVVVFQEEIDKSASITLVDGSIMTASQFIIFVISTVTALISATMSMFNPLRRFQQMRDAEAALCSAIWHYRTRTGPYACSRDGGSAAANASLRAQVYECRQKILGQADMSETSFYKQYPAHIYKHGQRCPPRDSAKKNKNEKKYAKKVHPHNGGEAVWSAAAASSLDLEAPDSHLVRAHSLKFSMSYP